MAKVTRRLRETWARQREQFLEERLVTQDGRPRPPESVREMDWDIALMDRLLALPLGADIPPPPPSPGPINR